MLKKDFYNYLKSYKAKECKKDPACGNISSMKKEELKKLAYKLGYTTNNRVYKGKKTEEKQSTPEPTPAPAPSAKGTLKSSMETLENKIKKIKKEIDEMQKKIDDPNSKVPLSIVNKLKNKKMERLKLLKELKAMKKKK